MARYLIKMKDGSVTVLTTVEKPGRGELLNCESCLKKWHPSNFSNVDSYRVLHEGELPADRYFRNAWCHQDDKFSIDMNKAREIHKNVLREKRKPLLAKLDVEYMKALEKNDVVKLAEISAKKQTLRDVTEDDSILKAASPDELKLAVPSILNE